MPKPKVDKGKKQECLYIARKTLSLASPGELEEYLSKVFSRAKELDEMQGKEAIQKAMGEVNNETLESLVNRVAITARNTEKFQRNIRYMKNGLNVRGFLIRTLKNKDYNVQASQFASIQDLSREVFANLEKDEVKIWESGKLDDEISAAASGKKVKDPLAQKLGEIYRRYPEEIRNPKMIESDALAIDEIRDDRFLRNTHNANRMYNAGDSLQKRVLSRKFVDVDKSKTIWRDDIMKEANLEETAKNINAMKLDGTVDMPKLTKFFENTFDKIINDTNDILTRSTVANDREALEKRKHMSIVWNDWSSFQRYNKKYGKGTLYQAMMSDIRASGNRIGIARLFGDSPVSMFKDLERQQEKIRPSGKMRKLEAGGLFNQVMGSKAAWSPTMANFGSSLRAYSSMSRLGMIVINSLNDITSVGGIAQRFGYGFWGNYADSLINAFGLLPNEHRQLLAKQMQFNLKSHMGYLGNFADASNLGEVMSKMSNTFYWLNFMEGWTNGLKLSGMTSIGKGLGQDSEKSFFKLNKQTQFQLGRLGINEHEWDALRSKTKNRFFSLDNVDSLTNSELGNLWEKSDKHVTKSEYKSHLQRKVYGIFDLASESASLDPGAYERMITTWNIAPGTPHGEAVRAFMQFKSYPVSYFRKSWYGGISDMQGPQAKIMYGLNMAAGNFILGYASVLLGNIAMGKSTPDISKMKKSDIAMLLAPGLGTFARTLNANQQDPKMIANFIMTPSVHLFGDPFIAATALATGNFKGAKKIGKDFMNYANPINTVPIAAPYLNELMGEKPRLEPTQNQVYGR